MELTLGKLQLAISIRRKKIQGQNLMFEPIDLCKVIILQEI